jgi:hypothetical protein
MKNIYNSDAVSGFRRGIEGEERRRLREAANQMQTFSPVSSPSAPITQSGGASGLENVLQKTNTTLQKIQRFIRSHSKTF